MSTPPLSIEAAYRALADGRTEEAEAGLARAAALGPVRPDLLTDLGALLRRRGKPAAAIACYRRALAAAPDLAGAWSNLGNALRDLGRLDDSVSALRRAVALAPGESGPLYNLALALRDARQTEEAEEIFAALAAGTPDNADYAWDLALSRLARGAFEAGFAGYEARLRLPRLALAPRPLPLWQRGEPLAGRTLLVASEQGFGDAIQFARHLPALAAQGARVILECQPEQVALFSRLPGLAQVIAKGAEPPPADLWVPLASLPHRLGLRPSMLPGPIPYLPTPPARLPPPPRPPGCRALVGLVWAGKPVPCDRSWPIDSLAPLFDLPGISWISLQTGPRAAELHESGFDRLVLDGGARLTSFADTAALLASLDLVVTVDTATAHLAGALGRPVWVLLRYVSDWRWGPPGAATTPWYPSMRLIRQTTPEDFTGPVATVRNALDRFAPRPA